jgi:hypothetical protein
MSMLWWTIPLITGLGLLTALGTFALGNLS